MDREGKMETDYEKVNLMFECLHKYMERIIDIYLRKHEEEQRKKEELCLTNIELCLTNIEEENDNIA